MNEPWNAPGWNPGHDFDAGAEYGEFDDVPAHAYELMDRIWERANMAEDPDGVVVPYQVAFAPLGEIRDGDSVAMYASGTESSPVVIIDWQRLNDANIIDNEEEVAVSVLHELRHGWQEAEQRLHPWQEEWDESFDVEADAEEWARSVWQRSPSVDQGMGL